MTPSLVNFVKAHEGFRAEAYQDTGSVWTIGYGSTGPDIVKGLVWTEEQAEFRLELDLDRAQKQAQNLLKRNQISSDSLDALTDFVYNLGARSLETSHLLQCVNSGDDIGAAKAFLAWDHVAQAEIKGLLIRRLEEAAMYLRGTT